MDTRAFSLSDLVPEPLYFVDNAMGGDGTRYEVLTADLLSEKDVAVATRLDARIRTMAEDPTVAIGAINDYMQLLVPTLPMARIQAIPMSFKTRFIAWWSEQQKPSGPKPTAAAGLHERGPVRCSPISAQRIRCCRRSCTPCLVGNCTS